jgi:hypothetical protein
MNTIYWLAVAGSIFGWANFAYQIYDASREKTVIEKMLTRYTPWPFFVGATCTIIWVTL